jgi:putative ABC transport system permease protein
METLLHLVARAFRQAVRGLAKHPAQDLAAMLILGLGLGLTAASESIVYGLYYRPLPFPAPRRLVRVEELGDRTSGLSAVPYEDFRAWSEGQTAFEGLVGWYPVAVAARAAAGSGDLYSAAYATPNLFRVLGARPILGRSFEAGDALAGSAPVVILGDAVWRSVFGADVQVVGRPVWVYGKRFTVVGVMAPGFRFPAAQKLWLPLTPAAQQEMSGFRLQVFGRLKAGVSADRAAAELRTILLHRPAWGGAERARIRTVVSPYMDRYVDAEMRSTHFHMLAGVLGLLLIACANVASLLLARAVPRAPEFAVRSALGATRRRLFAEVLAEPLLLAGGGALLAAAIAYLVTRFYAVHHEAARFAWEVVRFDAQSLAFILTAALASALLAGSLPALLASGSRDLRSSLEEASPGRPGGRLGRLLPWLVMVQVTLSCGLLIATGLTVKSVRNVLAVDSGFPTDHLLTADLSIYRTDRLSDEEGDRFMLEMARQAAALPGVRAAALARSLPIPRPGEADEPKPFSPDTLEPSAAETAKPSAFVEMVSPGYFEALGLRTVAGRTFTARDGEHGPGVAVVTETLARRVFGGAAALGHRVRFTQGWYEVVGVVSDSLLGGLGSDPHTAGVYLSLLQFPQFYSANCSLIVRTSGPPLEPVAELKRAAARANPDGQVVNVETMDERLAHASETYRMASLLFLLLGASAFAIMMAGIYGVTAFSAVSRRFEVSVRLAMGAQAREILYLLVRGEALPLVLGIVAGALLALSLSRYLRAVLFQVESWDPAVVGAVVAGTMLFGLLATVGTARRALAVAPAELLKRGG